MRRSLLTITILASAVLAGCEDGPVQTFKPAPNGAGNIWNNGNTDAAVSQGSQAFDAGYPTMSKNVTCSTDIKRQRWAWMLAQPIQPPRKYAGIDIAKNDLWQGLTIEDAESAPATTPDQSGGGLCQSTPLGFIGGCPSGIGSCNENYWGNNGEVFFSWNVATHIVDQMVLNLGYTGALATNPAVDHNGETHSYSMVIGDVIRRDGQPFLINWNGSPVAQITDIFNAAMHTYALAAGVPFDTDSKNCEADANCLVYNDGITTIMGFRPLVMYVEGTAGVPQPALSTPGTIYNFFNKWEPFSNLPQVLKLDKDGPVATGTPAGVPDGGTQNGCTQMIGQSFEDFRDNCVQVHGDKSDPNGVDAVNLNKILYGLTHDFEHWTASVMGVNQNFTSMKVANNPDIVVMDNDTPQPGDITQDWTFDVRARGQASNDFPSDGHGGYQANPDFRGSAMVYVEWARLMMADIQKMYPGSTQKKLGDPRCTGFADDGTPNYENWNSAHPADPCSGIEGLIIPGNGSFADDISCHTPGAVCLNPAANWDAEGFYPASILKPGGITGTFCIDPGNYNDCDYNPGMSPWFTALNHVTRVLADGNVNTLIPELRDRRYYYKWFGVAFIKYLKAYGNFNPALRDNWPTIYPATSGLGPTQVMNQIIDMESLFFDNNYGAAFDKFEYIDRDFIGQGAGGTYNWVPWDFSYGCDIKSGNQRYDDWYRRMDREEIAMYTAMLTDKTDTPGQENNVNITNLFGSPVLGGVPANGIAGMYNSYECAIGQGGDPRGTTPASKCIGSQFVPPPLDSTVMTACDPSAPACPAGQACVSTLTFTQGYGAFCGAPCDYVNNPLTGCASHSQTCVLANYANKPLPSGCLEMKMDLNGKDSPVSNPMLYYYPSVWTRTPFSGGHSPITVAQADKHPMIGAAKAVIPNFLAGPYTNSPVAAKNGACSTGYTLSTNGIWCNAALNSGTGNLAPTFSALTPWIEKQPGIGFTIPIDGQHDQQVDTAMLDYTGVLESYIVDYMPWTDPTKQSCVADGVCNTGYTCDKTSSTCVTDDNTIQIAAIEGADFLGQAFLCQDPASRDLLGVRMYDSALSIIDWLAAHPGDSYNPSAQSACQIIIRYSPYNNYPDFITSKANGVKLSINQGAGLGRVVDIVLFDPALIQAL